MIHLVFVEIQVLWLESWQCSLYNLIKAKIS